MPRTTIKLGTELAIELEAAIRAEGYGVLEKSRWVAEALTDFIAQRGAKLWDVGTGDHIEGYEGRLTLTLPEAASDALEQAVAAIRRISPLEEGIRSAVVRTAIRARVRAVKAAVGSTFEKHRRLAQRSPTRLKRSQQELDV